MSRARGHRKERCAVSECPRPWYVRDWCKIHYERWRTHSDPLTVKTCMSHGETADGKRPPEYATWASMIDRCHGPNGGHLHYGRRGISVCDRWRNSYPDFLADMGRRPTLSHTLDRIDNNGNYEPSNCRWATRREQARNMRKSRKITIDGVTRCASEWAELMGFGRHVIYNRLNRGWAERDAVLRPLTPKRKAA